MVSHAVWVCLVNQQWLVLVHYVEDFILFRNSIAIHAGLYILIYLGHNLVVWICASKNVWILWWSGLLGQCVAHAAGVHKWQMRLLWDMWLRVHQGPPQRVVKWLIWSIWLLGVRRTLLLRWRCNATMVDFFSHFIIFSRSTCRVLSLDNAVHSVSQPVLGETSVIEALELSLLESSLCLAPLLLNLIGRCLIWLRFTWWLFLINFQILSYYIIFFWNLLWNLEYGFFRRANSLWNVSVGRLLWYHLENIYIRSRVSWRYGHILFNFINLLQFRLVLIDI